MSLGKRFLELHAEPFVLPNPWDIGSARILASLGFRALATTSNGHAASLGRLDGRVEREEALAHAQEIAGATPLPVSADLEQGFGPEPEDVAATIHGARAAGLAGGSIEDYGGIDDPNLFEIGRAAERIAAAIEAAGDDDDAPVITARAENFFRGNPDLADTIARLQAYQDAGAPVLYAPGLRTLDEVRSVLAEIDRPLNVLLIPGGPSVGQLFEIGVKRISTGSALSTTAQAALVEAARELLGPGTHEFWERALPAAKTIREAFEPSD